MTWKSTVVVSGVGVLATWLASQAPPASIPTGDVPASPAAAPASARSGAASVDITEQADRLQLRMRQAPSYEQPARDPFRFGARTASSRSVAPEAPTTPNAPAAAPPPPAEALRITLSGIASDPVDGKEMRTAVLSTPAGILLVREGDDVAGQYRVRAIEAEAVDLVRLDDGGVLRLSLRP